jgi:hypothetical protein
LHAIACTGDVEVQSAVVCSGVDEDYVRLVWEMWESLDGGGLDLGDGISRVALDVLQVSGYISLS